LIVLCHFRAFTRHVNDPSRRLLNSMAREAAADPDHHATGPWHPLGVLQ
jgi:hypothetical protein